MEPAITHDETARRFYCSVNGLVCELDYTMDRSGTMDIVHTYVHPNLRGGGIAAALMKAATEFAAAKGYAVKPSCSYAALFYRRYPEYAAKLSALIDPAHGGD